MKTTEDIAELARAAGREGRTWVSWAADDVVGAFFDEHESDADTKAWEAAWRDGRLEHLRAAGWVERWTTAPVDYDSFGTETMEAGGEWHGRKLRRVLIDPRHVRWHEMRYGSGLHGTWEQDPRVEERQWHERFELERAERDRRTAARTAGLEWLRSLKYELIVDLLESERVVEDHDITRQDVLEERHRREAAMADEARCAEIATCRQLVRKGDTLIDDGASAQRGTYGWIAGRNPHVYYTIEERGHGDQAADDIPIRTATGEHVGSLAKVAERLRDGSLRVATDADDLPPAPVLARIGQTQRSEIRRVCCEGRTMWVGRPRFAHDPIVLDDQGHKIRRRADREAAIATFYGRL